MNKASMYNAKERRNSFDREAVQLLSTIASTQQREAEGLCQTGLQAFTSGSIETAIASLEQAIKLGASDKQGRYVLAASYYNRDEFDKCIPILKPLLADETPPPGADELLARAYIKILVKQGSAFGQSLQDEITLACAKYCEENPDAYPNTVSILERANELEPDALTHVKGLLAIAVKEEHWTEGCTYGARLSIVQHDADSIAHYAICLCKAMDSSDEAVEVYRTQLRNHPEDSEIRLRCAQAFMTRRQLGEAETLLRNGVTADPNDLRVRYHLALVLMMSGRIQDCIGELQQVLRTEGFDSYRSKEEIYVLQARCFVRMGMLEAAMKQYLLAGRSEKNLDDLYDLALKFEAAGDARNARACWEDVYATDIRFKDVATRICSAPFVTST
jgi:tetratricopeptide (TPR) repeat protein